MGETSPSDASEQPVPPAPPRRPGPATAAKSAAAAMDDLDAQEMAAALVDERDRAEEFESYRELPPVAAPALAEHIRGGRRVEDGRAHQMWDWTNADVARTTREVLRARFPDAATMRREISETEGFDGDGNRVRVDGGVEGIVGAGGDRFNDVVRELDGTKVFGTQRGLELPEVQILRTRYSNLVAQETEGRIQRETSRRWAGQWVLFAVATVLFVLFLVLIYSG